MAQFKLFFISIVVIFGISNVFCDYSLPICTKSIQCHSRYCWNGLCIKYGQSPDDVGPNPCWSVSCISEYECVLLQPTDCYKLPCRPLGRCVRRLPTCTDSTQCRTRYCRFGQCITYGDSPDDIYENPCLRKRCPGECILVSKNCVSSVCPPVAKCIPPINGSDFSDLK